MSGRPPEADDDLVDARLRSALRHAPDSQARPPEALRRAVQQAARAALPSRLPWWQRLLGTGPTIPRAWAAAAGIGVFGLALNLAWHLSNEPSPAEYASAPVASADKRAAPPQRLAERAQEKAAVPEPAVATAAAPALPPATRAEPARRPVAPADVAVVSAAPVPTSPAAPVTPAAAPAAPPVPSPPVAAAAPQDAAEASRRLDRPDEDQLAPAPQTAHERVEVAGVRSRGEAEPLAKAAAGAMPDGAGQPRPGLAATATDKPEAAPATTAWPAPLARLQAALAQAQDWPGGWSVRGAAEVPRPARAWWLAMLAGTSGRWQELQGPRAAIPPGGATWQVRAPEGDGFTLTLAEGQAWLQAGGRAWRAPWTVMP